MSQSKKKILVAMSGGVDSSVAAALLKEAGHEVAGATIRTWASNACASKNTKTCCGITGVEDARDVAAALNIPYWVFNFEEEFKAYVVDHFAAEYLKGRTPNPCISCNEHIKFRLFLARARELGYDFIATGHYAEVALDETRNAYYLKRGIDLHKDQSYVLFPLSQDVLSHLFLPIGGFQKNNIRAKAKALGLVVMNKPDSQEICFIPSNDYGTFLEKEFPKETAAQKGKIRTQEGKVLGEHSGFFHYTRGQRRGLGVAFSEKLYVTQTLPETNEVIVGAKKDVLDQVFHVSRLNWFLEPKEKQFQAQVKIRSQHQAMPASLFKNSQGTIRIRFDQPQEAITPGQGAAFYDGDRVLGGGWIESVELAMHHSIEKTPPN